MPNITKQQLRKQIGGNIRTERTTNGMSIDELAELMQQTPGFIGLIERGARGATIHNLKKLSKIFDVSIDSLTFHDKEKMPSSYKNLRSKILCLTSDFTEPELLCAVQAIKVLREMRQKKPLLTRRGAQFFPYFSVLLIFFLRTFTPLFDIVPSVINRTLIF